jgi:hypothetical protein
MGRRKLWPERTAVKFAANTFARIAAVLGKDEDRTDFVRRAVEREIRRREKQALDSKPRKRRAES